MLKVYSRPELTCYGGVAVGYYSPSNSAAHCQADCAAATCTFVATAALPACDVCDNTPLNAQCNAGLTPADCL